MSKWYFIVYTYSICTYMYNTYVKLLFCFLRVWSKLYNVVIVCSMQWSESSLCTHISPPSWTFLPPLHPTPLGHHRALSWALCATEQLPTSCLFYTDSDLGSLSLFLNVTVHVSQHLLSKRLFFLLSQFVPPAPSALCPHVDSLCLHLYSCPADRFFCTIFLDSIYICVNIWYLFFSFWLTSLWMTDSGFIHITTNDPIYFLFMAK